MDDLGNCVNADGQLPVAGWMRPVLGVRTTQVHEWKLCWAIHPQGQRAGLFNSYYRHNLYIWVCVVWDEWERWEILL